MDFSHVDKAQNHSTVINPKNTGYYLPHGIEKTKISLKMRILWDVENGHFFYFFILCPPKKVGFFQSNELNICMDIG